MIFVYIALAVLLDVFFALGMLAVHRIGREQRATDVNKKDGERPWGV